MLESTEGRQCDVYIYMLYAYLYVYICLYRRALYV